jgi:aspartokinase
LDNLLEVVFKNKKQMKIVKFGGKSLANGEGINTVLDIIERKIKQEEKSLSWFQQGKATDELTIFLLLQPKWKLQTALESFKTYQKKVLMQSIFRQNLIN